MSDWEFFSIIEQKGAIFPPEESTSISQSQFQQLMTTFPDSRNYTDLDSFEGACVSFYPEKENDFIIASRVLSTMIAQESEDQLDSYEMGVIQLIRDSDIPQESKTGLIGTVSVESFGMSKRIFLIALLLWVTSLCRAQAVSPIRFEYLNVAQFSTNVSDSRSLAASFAMAPGVCFSDKFVLSVPAKMNMYTLSRPQSEASYDIMVGLSAAYRYGSVDIEASHLFGVWYSDLGQMETGLSLIFNRGKKDRTSFYKVGVSYLTPYLKENKGGVFVSAGLGLRFSLAKRSN